MILFNQHLFPPATDKQFWTLSKTISRNEFIDPPHHFCDHMYLVKAGAIKVGYLDETKEIILSFAVEGELVCNFISFLTGKVSNVYLQAIKKTELIGFTKATFNELLHCDSAFATNYQKALESKIVEILNRHVI